MTVAEILTPLFDRVLSFVRDQLFGLGHAAEKVDRVVTELRDELQRAAIEMRFAEIDLKIIQLDAEHLAQKIEEREAYERGRDMAPPPENVTIVDPDEEKSEP